MIDLMKKELTFPGGEKVSIDLNNPVARYSYNPIITAEDVNKIWINPAHQVTTVHNSGIIFTGDDYLMLFRSHLRCGICVLGIARSLNGVNNWIIDPEPVLKPANENDIFAEGTDQNQLIENESGGLEDPRISKIGDQYAIIYSAYHSVVKDRVRVSLITTKDFKSYVRRGPILDCDMRNVVFFDEKINDKFVGLFRPNDDIEGDVGGIFAQILIGYSDDWTIGELWNVNKKPLMQTGFGPSAFQAKIGPCAPPMKTDKGWINIFHGVRGTMDGNPYVLGVALHDLDDPSKVKMCSIPILFPTACDCIVNDKAYIHVPNVVFCCGAVPLGDGRILIYYAGSDSVMDVAITHEDILIEMCERYAQDPVTGKLLFDI